MCLVGGCSGDVSQLVSRNPNVGHRTSFVFCALCFLGNKFILKFRDLMAKDKGLQRLL